LKIQSSISGRSKIEVSVVTFDAKLRRVGENTRWFMAEEQMHRGKKDLMQFISEKFIRKSVDGVIAIGINQGEDRFQMYMLVKRRVVNLIARVN
jgi:hypothetical protein